MTQTKIIMFPAVGVRDENRYIDILVEALRYEGVAVEGWTKHLSFQSGDVFHVHWPEIVPEIRTRPKNGLRGIWIAHQFFSTIRRVKKAGGRVVWTVHDLAPHVAELGRAPYYKRFMEKFMAEVDVAISLTEAGISQIRETLPGLAHARFAVARHPHYRGVLGKIPDRADARAWEGLPEGLRVFSFIGTLRPNKHPEAVVRAFRELPREGNFLLIAGGASPEIAAKVRAEAANIPNHRFEEGRIPEGRIKRLYVGSDVLVFPGTDYFNSGTIYTALSLNLPVIAAWSPANAEIQQAVGKDWLHLYRGELTAEALREGAEILVHRGPGVVCDLSRFSPESSAREHVAAYQDL